MILLRTRPSLFSILSLWNKHNNKRKLIKKKKTTIFIIVTMNITAASTYSYYRHRSLKSFGDGDWRPIFSTPVSILSKFLLLAL